MNGRLRKDLPRSTNIKAMPGKSFEQIILNQNLIPRKCLNGKSPIEALANHLGKDNIFQFNKDFALRL